MDRFEKIVEVAAPVENVFRALSDYESYPNWMHNIAAVRRTEGSLTEWRGGAPPGDDKPELCWTAETTIFEPDRRIMWQAIKGDVATDCEIVLQETKDGTTLVRMVRGFEVKGEAPPDASHTSIIEYQRLRLEEDLARLKRLVESSHSQPQTDAINRARAASVPEPERQETNSPPSEAEKILKRGVDRLLDEPPSKEWRK